MVLCRACHIVSETIDGGSLFLDGIAILILGSTHQSVLLQCLAHMLLDIRAVICQEIILLPIIEHAVFHCLLVLFSVRSPYNDISQVAGFHTGLVYAVTLHDNIDLHIPFFLQDLCKPSLHFSGIVGQLAIHIQRDLLVAVQIASLDPKTALGRTGVCRRSTGAAAGQQCGRHSQGKYLCH